MDPLPPQPQFQAPVAAPVLPPMTASMPASMPAPALTPKMPAAAPLTMPSEMPSTSSMPAPMALDDGPIEAPLSRGRKILRILKSILIAASVVIIVVGAAQTAIELLFPDTATQTPAATPTEQSGSPAKTEPKTRAPSSTPSRPMPAPEGTLPAPSTADPDQTNSINSNSSFFDPTTAIKLPDVTGSIPRKTAAPRPQATTPTGQSNIETLPTSISPALRTAAAANDPAAEYEIGSRYAEGRGVPQNVADAVLWLQRAADAGFAPAQFRLASLNEKGDGGLKKDLQTARRLYLAAAGKGHAKAMHNLAVLYAEGIDGKPDYKAASEWFRKAFLPAASASR
jgi:localization factor PodJL